MLHTRIGFALLGSFCATFALGAQPREVQQHEIESAEGRLMGFYSAALATTPLGMPLRGADAKWSVELSLELGYVPWLDSRQRSAGFDKPEASNLSPVLPRPHVSLLLPAALLLDVSWVPPVGVLDATANLLGVSLRRSFSAGGFAVAPRVGIMVGRVQGAITCSKELGSGEPAEQLYFADVCYANESEDYFDPAHLSFDVAVSGASVLSGTPWVSAGVRREKAEFDIGVIDESGERDLDHPILEMRATRFFATAGLQWDTRRTRYGIELFVSPGSLTTARLFAAYRIR